jgi:branched-chain amino acid transport system substrate-binding protein
MSQTIRLFGLTAMLAFALVFMGAAKDAPKAPAKAKPPAIGAKIGVISILTGQGSGYGEAITNGFKLARDEINAKGDVRIDLVIEDSSGKQEQALAAAQKLINSAQVVAILGPTLSTEMKVVGPEANARTCHHGDVDHRRRDHPDREVRLPNSLPESQAIPASVRKAVRNTISRRWRSSTGTTTSSPSPASTR